MIGLQKIVIDNKVSVIKLSEELNITPNSIWRWFQVNRIPDKYLNYLALKFEVDKTYLNKKVNDIIISQPRKKGFNNYSIKDDIVEIYLENKKGYKTKTIIDIEDLQMLIDLNYHWYLQWDVWTKSYYAATSIYPDGYGKKGKTLRLNMLLANSKQKVVADHIDRDTLNNRRLNLRITNISQNSSNRDGANCNSKTGVRNVNYIEKLDEYWVQIMKDGVRYKWVSPSDKFDEACKFAEMKRQEIFGIYAGVGQKD